MGNAARTMAFHTHLKDAIVVYPQGLNTPGRLTDPEGKKPGWQGGAGELEDRDLRFFDAMRESLLKAHGGAKSPVFSTGHSNGGGFTYLLWAMRPKVFTAIAPSAAGGGRGLLGVKITPVPVLHTGNEDDPLVRYVMQERTMAFVRRVNQCTEKGKPWEVDGKAVGVEYASRVDAPLVTVIGKSGGHKYGEQTAPITARFFERWQKTI
jgi:polyhydroxybutyrate depolymerase